MSTMSIYLGTTGAGGAHGLRKHLPILRDLRTHERLRK
jgi:hypothetical protein